MQEIEYKDTLLHMANEVASIVLAYIDEGFEKPLGEGMAVIARCVEVSRITIWQNKMKDGRLQYVQMFGWTSDSKPQSETISSGASFACDNSFPEWEKMFLKGECINRALNCMPDAERQRMQQYGVKAFLAIPVILQDRLWGFVSVDDCHTERSFTEEEVDILHSISLMMARVLVRHETTSRMREADEYSKLMLDATPLSCCLWDSNHNLIDCNNEAITFFEMKDKQDFLRRFNELFPEFQPDGRSSLEKMHGSISRAFRDGKAVAHCIHQKLDGTPIPSEITLVRVKHGDEYIIAAYIRDLREHEKMMAAIEYKDTLLRTVNEMAGILLRSETDEFERSLYRCMGMMAESVAADRMYIWKNHEKDGQMHSTQLYEWSEGAEPQQGGEYVVDIPYNVFAPSWRENLPRGQCINGIVTDLPPAERQHLAAQGVLSILVVPVFMRDKFWGFVGFDDCNSERVFSDEEISILRSGSLLVAHSLLRNEMTHEIQAAVEQAQAASKSKSAFLAHMSHEIRTPMNVIAGMTELILREDVPQAIYEHVMSVKHASTNMLSLINDILDFSKIEAGGLELIETEYWLTSLLNDVLIIIRMKVSEKPILFTVNIDCNIPNRLIGDETRVRQILLNVLDNAAKYTKQGFVSLNMTGEMQGDTVILTAEVSDSGIGIGEDDLHKLFDDFARFDGDLHKGVQGTGLGLPITRSLCKGMGGSITVQSEYGVGSTFTITLPQKIKPNEKKFAHVSEPDKKRVLLYETRTVYADSIARSVENLGVRCTLVCDRQEFYEELKRQSYSTVFMSSLLSESSENITEELEPETTLVLLTEFGEVPAMRGVRSIAMPVHAATIANILDDIEDNFYYIESGQENIRFIAPTAEILVVDDLNTNLKVAEGLMLPYQMQIDICDSGEKAVECVKKKRYDIIFMDHMMPGMDGIETAVCIRSLQDESGYYANVPIIALTANAVSGVKEMFLENGMNDFLAKPIDVKKLHGLLEKWIPADKKEKIRAMKENEPSEGMTPGQIQIDGLDVQAGIVMSGGTADGYLKTLAIFYTDAMDRISKIRDCLQESDIKLYTTYVHAIKSASASIGAWELSDLFKDLEMAGLSGDAKFMHENTERTLDKMHKLLKKIYVVVSENQNEPTKEDDPELLKNELSKLKEALGNRDAGDIDEILKRLETVRWTGRTNDMLKEVYKNILLINYSDAAVLIDKLLD